jgi:5-hydroxyisourate hydrolase
VGKLTTHVTDTAQGRPGSGVRVDLYSLDGESGTFISSVVTGADGRPELALMEGEAFRPGTYELVFHIGDYFRGQGLRAAFLELVPVRFGVEDTSGHCHVPLLVSPWSYTTCCEA